MSAVPKNLTITEAAKAARLSVRHLNRLVRDGDGPPRAADGTFQPAELEKWAAERGTEQGSSKAIRDRQAEAKARLLEMRVAELAGELCRTDDMVQHWAGMIGAARAKFLALPGQVAMRIAPPERIAETQEIVRGLVYAALSELAAGGALPPATVARQERTKRAGKRAGGGK